MESFDDMFRSAIILLHSPSPESASLMRHIVEKEITKQEGKSKTLKAKMSEEDLKKLRTLERQAVGSGFKPKKKIRKVAEKLETKKEPSLAIQHNIEPKMLDHPDLASGMKRSIAFELINEYLCQICHQMESTTVNPLMECSVCTLLFHAACCQESSTKDQKPMFVCSSCKPKAPIMRKDLMKVIKKTR